MSFPPPPEMVSAPPHPQITSLPGVPVNLSLLAVPLIVQPFFEMDLLGVHFGAPTTNVVREDVLPHPRLVLVRACTRSTAPFFKFLIWQNLLAPFAVQDPLPDVTVIKEILSFLERELTLNRTVTVYRPFAECFDEICVNSVFALTVMARTGDITVNTFTDVRAMMAMLVLSRGRRIIFAKLTVG